MEQPQPLAQVLQQLAERHGIQDIYVFGGRAKEIADRVSGRQRAVHPSTSDVDIAVQPLPGRRLNARARVRLAAELEDLFAAPRVDVVILSEARAFLALDVVRGELLYTADARAQAEQELYILRRAGDLAPFQRERVRQILTGNAR